MSLLKHTQHMIYAYSSTEGKNIVRTIQFRSMAEDGFGTAARNIRGEGALTELQPLQVQSLSLAIPQLLLVQAMHFFDTPLRGGRVGR
jgi:hypothetical protein